LQKIVLIPLTLLNIIVALGALASIYTIVAFFRKPLRYRFLLLPLSFVTFTVIFYFLQKNKTSNSDTIKKDPLIQKYDTVKETPTVVTDKVTKPITKQDSKVNENNKEIIPNTSKKENEIPSNDSAKNIPENETNNYINNTTTKSDIAILIIDNNNHQISSISSDIANLYRGKGYSVNTSLFTSSFFNSNYLSEVQSANSRIIEKLNLADHVKYIVIGKYSKSIDPGDEVKWICRASLDVTVIACSSKSQADGFLISVSNGFDDKQHAETGAIEKIVQSFKISHLNL
jgi:hypothetical protein